MRGMGVGYYKLGEQGPDISNVIWRMQSWGFAGSYCVGVMGQGSNR